jgi:hypothetical protein
MGTAQKRLPMTILHGLRLSALLLVLILGEASLAGAAATPTPVPGGANQTNGVSGTMGDVLFNGRLRLRSMSLAEAGPADNIKPNAGDERALVFRAIVSNGTQHEDHGYFDASLVDANGITVAGRPLDSGWSVQPGAAARLVNGFSVPPGFVPVRLVLIESATKTGAFRIAIRPGDLAAPGGAKTTP